jgi:CRP-like cAMP-binding protein
MSADRARSLNFAVTHAFLAMILGVRRVGVTQAAGALSARGLIEYQRGRMVIRDRRALQAVACPCYRIDLETYREAFPP